jgi:hypothetical protein
MRRSRDSNLAFRTRDVEKQIRRLEVKSRHYDIVRKEADRYAVWLEAASDLNTAECRIEELISFCRESFRSWINKIIRQWRRSLVCSTARKILVDLSGN